MKKIKLVVIACLLFLATQTYAQNSGGHYDTDIYGRKTWVGDDGTKGTYDKDIYGRKTYEDNKGTKATYDKDIWS